MAFSPVPQVTFKFCHGDYTRVYWEKTESPKVRKEPVSRNGPVWQQRWLRGRSFNSDTNAPPYHIAVRNSWKLR